MSFLSKLFGKEEEKLPPVDLSLLKTDIHSHLIPGIDDGAQSMDEAIVMLAKFENLGYQKVITTPHIMSDMYRNTPEVILDGLNKVRELKSQLNLKIEIEAAAEYYYDEALLKKLENNEQLLTFDDNYLLFEFSFHSEPDQVENLFFQLLSRGYKPVLAHFERYLFLQNNIDRVFKWREEGINIQLNINSLSGHYGAQVKTQAEQLVDAAQVDFAGSDCHRIEHLMLMEKHLNNPYLHKLINLPLKNSLLG